MKKFPYYLLLTLLLSFSLFLWECFPLLSGYGAKVCCSAVFISHRVPDSVIAHDLGHFPFNLARYRVDWKDSAVHASVWGMAVKTAVYHTGLGAVLVNGTTEAALKQSWRNLQTAVPPIDATAPPVDTALPGTTRSAALADVIRSEVAHNGTRALLIVYKDKIVGEGYAPGFDKDMPLAGWSMTKGVTSALLGILARDKKLDIHAPAPVAAWQGDDRRNIRVEDLMHMRSGLRWWEFYIGPCPCTDMLFKARDMGEAATHSPLRHAPGALWWRNGGRWPHVPADAYAAEGYEGQYICVVPSRNLVVVRLALEHGKAHPDSLKHEVLQALP
jgi:CubicO group peptidase (beta-lactamase class C family)